MSDPLQKVYHVGDATTDTNLLRVLISVGRRTSRIEMGKWYIFINDVPILTGGRKEKTLRKVISEYKDLSASTETHPERLATALVEFAERVGPYLTE